MTTLGVVGGAGWLGGALLRPALSKRLVAPADLIVSSRSGGAAGFDAWPGIRFTANNAMLARNADVVVLSVRPQDLDVLSLDLAGKLTISVMAMVPMQTLREKFGSERIIRAMPNACAEQELSFTPWFATTHATEEDRRFAEAFLACSGKTVQVATERELDYFTGLTGSGPAFVAAFADAMIRDAIANGIEPGVADAAVRQLFLGGSTLMAQSAETPAQIVGHFLDYAGTTAAGLTAMQIAGIASTISKGLAAARDKAATG